MYDKGKGEWRGERKSVSERREAKWRERERERVWCDFLCDRAPQQTWRE